jgi:hypothetical protein
MSSYVLFTIDKLVQKVVKQMQLVLQEEQTHRLVELWKYEDARGGPVSVRASVLGAVVQSWRDWLGWQCRVVQGWVSGRAGECFTLCAGERECLGGI